MRPNFTATLVKAIFFTAFAACGLVATETEDLKSRIQKRTSVLRPLYEDGAILEGPEGMLKPGPNPLSSGQRELIEAENRDRKLVIALAAKASNLTESEVSARFAERAARTAPRASNGPIGPCRIVPAKLADVQPLVTRYRKAVDLYSRGSFSTALTELEETLKLEKNFVGVRQNIAAIHLRLRRFKEAESSLKDEIQLLNCLQNIPDRDLNRLAYMFNTDKPEKERNAAQTAHLKSLITKARYSILYNLACIFSAQNVRSLAVTYLTQSIQNGFSDEALLQRDPDLANIRDSQEFQELLWAVRSRARK